ncbi:MAG: UpxY family transcription antiterminator [Bacteroidota bacterium]
MAAKKAATYENHLHEEQARWFAVHTQYKREKLVQKALAKQGITAYLPLRKFTRHYTRKVKTVELPLISCYVFVKITKASYLKVLQTEYVLEFVKFSRNLIAIPESEMEIMRRVIGEAELIDVQPQGYQVGDQVEIIGGELTGLKGKLVEVEGKKRMVIALERLGYMLYIQVAPELLHKVA